MATTFNVINLGAFTNLDAREGGQPERADQLNFQTFGTAENPLYNNILTFAPAGNGPAGTGLSTAYEGDGDRDQFSLNGGPVKTVEAFIFMQTTVTYIDGTTASFLGRVMQDTDLQLYLVPSITQDDGQDKLEAQPIVSVTFGRFENASNGTFQMVADRDPNELVPVIDGTAGDDVMNVGFADQANRNGNAPRIDNNDNYIRAGAGNDTVFGGGGNDTIDGGSGNDRIQGGAGADVLIGGDGSDTVDYSDNTQAVTVNLATNTVSGGTAQGDRISGFENVIGGSGNDRLTLSNTSGTASGGAGDDVITGGAGDDTLDGGDGNDTLRGGDGADRLLGGAGNDILSGGAGADILDGGSGNDILDGGAGIDTLTGGDGADVFIADGTADLITDFGVGSGPIKDGNQTNNDFVDLSAFYNPTTLAAWNAANPDQQFENELDWLRADYQNDGALDQAGGLRIRDGSGGLVDANALAFETTNVCFASGTMITTPNGDIAIERLRTGDLVETADHGARKVRWIGSSRVPAAGLALNPKLRPIRIAAGALGRGTPRMDLLVSPQHRIFVNSPILERMVGYKEGLIAAKHLVGVPGIAIADDVVTVTYWHFLFDAHELVFANGAAAESLFTGPVALKSVPAASRDEILALFPELETLDYDTLAVTAARPFIKGRTGRTLVERHVKNAKDLVG